MGGRGVGERKKREGRGEERVERRGEGRGEEKKIIDQSTRTTTCKPLVLSMVTGCTKDLIGCQKP